MAGYSLAGLGLVGVIASLVLLLAFDAEVSAVEMSRLGSGGTYLAFPMGLRSITFDQRHR